MSSELYSPKFPIEWDACPLFELAEWINGMAFRNINFSDKGLPVIKIAEIKNGISSQTKFTSDTYDEKYHIYKGDLIFSWSGNPDTSIDIFYSYIEEGWLNQHLFKVIPDNNIVYNEFFYYLMKYSKKTFRLIASNKQTTGLGHVTLKDIKNIMISYPNLIEQKNIIAILFSLDKKIQLNTQMNATLEAIGQALFRRWFVDFEFPDENGNPYRSSGGEMVDSELGPIPKGWKIGKIEDMLKHEKISIKPNKLYNNIYYYSIPSYDNGKTPLFEDPTTIKSNKFFIKSNCILFSKLNPFTPRVWLINNIEENSSICSTEFLVLIPKHREFKNYCYYLLSSNIIINNMASSASGTSSSHQRIKPSDLMRYTIKIPNDNILNKYSKILEFHNTLIDSNNRNKEILSDIRDTLLPKLMSGEIRVPVEEVAAP